MAAPKHLTREDRYWLFVWGTGILTMSGGVLELLDPFSVFGLFLIMATSVTYHHTNPSYRALAFACILVLTLIWAVSLPKQLAEDLPYLTVVVWFLGFVSSFFTAGILLFGIFTRPGLPSHWKK